MRWIRNSAVLAAALTAGCAQLQSLTGDAPSVGQRLAEVEDRLDELQSQVEAREQLELTSRLQALEETVRGLSGQVEEQGYRIEALKERQRDLYADLDRRLRALEVGGAPAGGGEGGRDGAARTPAGGDDAYDAYQAAFALIQDGRYPQAVKAFRQFLDKHPDGAYADNARYWLGEAHYVSGNYEPALRSFQDVIDKHPDSPKAADARLKIGYTHYELEQWDKARQALQQVIDDYPETSSANLARQRLQRMEREGR